MAAFSDSTLTNEQPTSRRSSSDRPSRASSKLSARAQATLDAMKDVDLNAGSQEGYPPPPPVFNGDSRRHSNASVTLGYPMNFDKPKGTGVDKGADLAKAFGMVDHEAWEDYGRTYGSMKDDSSSTQSAETLATPATTSGRLTRGQRDLRAASVWDMEATLREGKPVASGMIHFFFFSFFFFPDQMSFPSSASPNPSPYALQFE
jgi:hypothetical protein